MNNNKIVEPGAVPKKAKKKTVFRQIKNAFNENCSVRKSVLKRSFVNLLLVKQRGLHEDPKTILLLVLVDRKVALLTPRDCLPTGFRQKKNGKEIDPFPFFHPFV